MKKAFSTQLGASFLVAVGVAFTASSFTPARAFTFTNTGQVAGNPGNQALWNIGINSNDIGQSFSLDWFLSKDQISRTASDLSATGTFKVNSLTSNLLSLEVKIDNKTIASDPKMAAILSFGFGLDPNATSVSMSGGQIFDGATVQSGQQQFTGGFKNIDVCIFASDGCSGSSVNDGLWAGRSDTFTLNIGGNFGSTPAVTLQSMPLKFQSQWGSFELAGRNYRTISTTTTTTGGTTGSTGSTTPTTGDTTGSTGSTTPTTGDTTGSTGSTTPTTGDTTGSTGSTTPVTGGVNYSGSDNQPSNGPVYEVPDIRRHVPEPTAATAILLTALALRYTKRQKRSATV